MSKRKQPEKVPETLVTFTMPAWAGLDEFVLSIGGIVREVEVKPLRRKDKAANVLQPLAPGEYRAALHVGDRLIIVRGLLSGDIVRAAAAMPLGKLNAP